MWTGILVTWTALAAVGSILVCGPGVRYKRWMNRIRKSGL